ncbi:MAG: sigma-54-dependent Fis family transcriptional regulator [Oligoflexia bacterium]|nr:sigma-54-dependent Fis family transcriptional regulator [Oligoflexia bacterium]
MSKNYVVLVIEDNDQFRKFISRTLSPLCQVMEVDDEPAAMVQIKRHHFDAVIIDINLHGKESGFDILKKAKEKGLFTVMLTDQDNEESVTKAYKIGCNHYLTKDRSENILKFIIKERISELEGHFTPSFFQREYITQHVPLINEISSLKKRLMDNRSLLILGPTGTGKTRLAEIIHTISGGKPENFIALNVSAIPENLLESELFGHVKGAFTGADREKKGMLELANEGTLFLDEVTSMPLMIQQKLLKCLDERCFYPVGATKSVVVKFRLITATCEDIYKLIQEDQFRLDLFYRINGLIINIPPLKDRSDDIPLLVKYFLKLGSRQVIIKEEAMMLLKKYSWSGNIRELKSVIEQLSTIESGEIHAHDLPEHIQYNQILHQKQQHKRFLSEEHVNYVLKHGIFQYMDKVQAEMIYEILSKSGQRPMTAQKMLKASTAGYYKMFAKAQRFRDDLKSDVVAENQNQLQ